MAPIIRKPQVLTEKRVVGSRPATPAGTPAQVTVSKPVAGTMPSGTANPAKAPILEPRLDKAEFDRQVNLAKQEAIKAVQAEAEAIKSKAHEAGFAAGLKQATDQVAQGQAELSKQLEQLGQRLLAQCKQDQSALETEAAAIAFEVLCKLASHRLLQPDAINAMVREAMTHVSQRGILAVRLHSTDLAKLQEYDDQDAVSTLPMKWVTDDTLPRGGCVIETTLGELDARLDHQLEQLAMVLRACAKGDKS